MTATLAQKSFPEAGGLPYRVDMSRAFPSNGHTLPAREAAVLQSALADLIASGEGEFTRLPEKTDDLAAIQTIAERFRRLSKHLVIAGTGGSSLGGQAVTALAPHSEYTVTFVENVDPYGVEQMVAQYRPEETVFAFISKSGGTLETMTQMLLIFEQFIQAGKKDALKERCVAITMTSSSPMRTLAEAYDVPTLEHAADLGGRFSVLSAVGMLPAAFLGLDVRAFREGAGLALKQAQAEKDADANPVMVGAWYQHFHHDHDRRNHVLMTYGDRFGPLGEWFRQLVAESLGKEGKGVTPLPARGTVDQHSILQLFLDGPSNKIYTFLLGDYDGKGPQIPAELATQAGIPLLAGKHAGDVLAAFEEGIVGTLSRRGLPVRVIRVREADARTLGALFMHFMLETVLTARLMLITPFDQPAVEDCKVIAKEYLSRK